eukprot:6129014-Prymnesium_polylepis.1
MSRAGEWDALANPDDDAMKEMARLIDDEVMLSRRRPTAPASHAPPQSRSVSEDEGHGRGREGVEPGLRQGGRRQGGEEGGEEGEEGCGRGSRTASRRRH